MVPIIAYLSNSLCNICEAHCRALAMKFRNDNYDYAHSAKAVYSSFTVSREGVTHATDMHNVYGIKLRKDGYCMVMLDGCLRRRYVEMLEVDDGVEYDAEPLGIRHDSHLYSNPISPAQAIKLVKTVNISTKILSHEARFTDTVHSLLRHARAFEEDYGVRFVAGHVTNIMEEMWSSHFLSTNSRATYIRRVTVRKMMIKHQGALPHFKKLGKGAPAGKNFGITHLDEPSHYSSYEEDILLMLQATDEFDRIDHKPTSFYANSFL